MGQVQLHSLSATVIEYARTLIARHEGYSEKPYKDTEGVLTIGIGRNLEDRGLSADEVMYLFRSDLRIAAQDAAKLFHNISALDPLRQAVLLDMAFNLGYNRLAGFEKFRAAVALRDFDLAADEMLDSKWARQVGKEPDQRAGRLARIMRTGRLSEE
tara:strand:+ start:11257 stop:11727 length:471 start_codon:yes stop_codon:yes gene_type:complete